MKFIALNRESTTTGLCLKLAGYVESDYYDEEHLFNKLNESSLIKYEKENIIFYPIYDNLIEHDIDRLVYIIRMLIVGIFSRTNGENDELDDRLKSIEKEVNSIVYKYKNLR